MKFRTDDYTRWGPGTGGDVDLDAVDVDLNFWEVLSGIEALQDHAEALRGIDYITVSGNQLTFHMTDHTLEGPFTIPTAAWTFRGMWLPVTVYNAYDVITFDGSTYLVLLPHTSASSFDPNATDGLSHNLYGLMLTDPGDVLPLRGTTGQFLVKRSDTDLDVEWATEGTIPPHGAAGDKLVKHSSSDFDTMWVPDDLAGLADVALATDLASGDLLSFDGSAWQNVPQSSLVLTPAQTRNGQSPSLGGTTGTLTLDPTRGDVFPLTPTGNVTLDAASAPIGARITLVVTTSGTSSFNVTPGASFKSTGALATGAVSGKIYTVEFVGDGVNLNETSRTTAM